MAAEFHVRQPSHPLSLLHLFVQGKGRGRNIPSTSSLSSTHSNKTKPLLPLLSRPGTGRSRDGEWDPYALIASNTPSTRRSAEWKSSTPARCARTERAAVGERVSDLAGERSAAGSTMYTLPVVVVVVVAAAARGCSRTAVRTAAAEGGSFMVRFGDGLPAWGSSKG